MGYYNIIFHYGISNFVKKCKESNVDGLIIVDLQPEEDPDLIVELRKNGIDLIRLVAPTTNTERLKTILSASCSSSDLPPFPVRTTVILIPGLNSLKIRKCRQPILPNPIMARCLTTKKY